jgi:ribosomal protein S27E
MSGLVGFEMPFSAADLTLLRIRCPGCGQHSEKLVTVLVKKDAIACAICSTTIDLTTPHNTLLIKETAESCVRIGAALTKLI